MERRMIQGRSIGTDEINLIRQLIAGNPSWSRSRLSRELCQLWDWCTPTGQLKDIAARSLLRKLDAQGEIRLPSQRNRGGGELWGGTRWEEAEQIPLFQQGQAPLAEPLASLQPVEIVLAEEREDRALFTSLLREHHYLGLSRSVGQNLKYLVYDRHARPLACMLFGSPAWRCADRDDFIGWSDETRAKRLNWTTNNTRFLVLPWVRAPHLASHVLGRVLRRIRADWHARYGQPLVLVETFVDQTRFAGTCYKAANWIRVGQTKGRSRNDRDHSVQVPAKAVYVYPLVSNFREVLCR